MDDKKKAFLEYIEAFKKLDVSSKRSQLIGSLKEFLVVFEGLAISDNVELEYMTSKEVLDFKSGTESEDDFLEAALVYLEIAKDIIGQYLLHKQL